MTDAPSPFAPGIISEERSPPRAPGRPVVFLVAAFVMSALVAGLWQMWVNNQAAPTEGAPPNFLFPILANAPFGLTLLWAYLTDRVPVLGSRREGYLLLTAPIMAVAWLGIAAADGHAIAWAAAGVPSGLASAVSSATIVGALAEIGRRHAATGRLAAAKIGLVYIAELAARPAMMWLALVSIWAAAGLAVGLALAVVLLIVTLSDDETPAPAVASEARVGIPTFLRSRDFWALVPLLVCAGVATLPDALVTLRLRSVNEPSALQVQQWLRAAVILAAPAAYALICRRLPLRNTLRLALFLKALVLVACGRIFGAGEGREIDLSLLVLSAVDGLVGVAVLDLALRAAPPGREAFGGTLLLGVWSVAKALVSAIALPLDVSLAAMTWFASGAVIVAALAAGLLPGTIAGRAEGASNPG